MRLKNLLTTGLVTLMSLSQVSMADDDSLSTIEINGGASAGISLEGKNGDASAALQGKVEGTHYFLKFDDGPFVRAGIAKNATGVHADFIRVGYTSLEHGQIRTWDRCRGKNSVVNFVSPDLSVGVGYYDGLNVVDSSFVKYGVEISGAAKLGDDHCKWRDHDKPDNKHILHGKVSASVLAHPTDGKSDIGFTWGAEAGVKHLLGKKAYLGLSAVVDGVTLKTVDSETDRNISVSKTDIGLKANFGAVF